MLKFRRRPRIEAERMSLRLPEHRDWRAWAALREASANHLMPWEPVWAHDHLSRRAFTNRVYWAQRAETQGTALPLMLVRRSDNQLLGAITLDNIRRGPVQAGTLGYWIGAPFARQACALLFINGLCELRDAFREPGCTACRVNGDKALAYARRAARVIQQ